VFWSRRAGSIVRLRTEVRLEAGRAHSEVEAPQQQWFLQQLLSLPDCRVASEDGEPDDSDRDGFDSAIMWWQGIASCAAGAERDSGRRTQHRDPAWASSGAETGASMTNSKHLAAHL
jgi:hypothetical protein